MKGKEFLAQWKTTTPSRQTPILHSLIQQIHSPEKLRLAAHCSKQLFLLHNFSQTNRHSIFIPMINRSSFLLFFFIPIISLAQYGTFSKDVVDEFKKSPLSVVLDNGQSEYNDYIHLVMEDAWKLNKVDFISMADFKMAQFETERSFLVKVKKSTEQKQAATFLTILRGWKKKSGEATTYGNSIKNVDFATEVASIMLDPDKMEQDQEGPKLWLYTKSIANFIELVGDGKITDKTTADKMYSKRTRNLHEMQLVMTKADLDASVREPKQFEEFYTKAYQIVGEEQEMGAIESEDKNLAVVDVVFTGEHKTRHCYKTIYSVRTGEIMYMNNDASLYGKKQGLIEEDLKNLERAR